VLTHIIMSSILLILHIWYKILNMDENNINLEETGFDFELDGFQLEAIEHINKGNSVVVCAPTGAGKTVIAEHAVICAFKQNKRLFYTTPLKALSNQKFNDFSNTYGQNNVGLLTGDISINRDARIVVMTTEVFRNMLYGTNLGRVEENLKNVQYVVLDEVHYMNDEQRGTVWEESIIYVPNNIQLIALSATIANSSELTKWINTVHGKTELVDSDFRPVPLRYFYYSESHPEDILSLFAPGGKLNSKIKHEKPSRPFIKKAKNNNQVTGLVKVLSQKEMLPAIYFTFSRKKCDANVIQCSKLKLLNEFEERRLSQIIDEYILDNPYICKHRHLEYLYAGVASHHAGLLPVWKVLVEKLFQQGLIKVIFATETLAAGINMPARTTVISSISKRSDEGHRVLTASEFLQMSGRAGRRGMDDIGYVVVVGTPFQSPDEVASLASSAADPLGSRFTSSYSMVLNLLQRFTVDDARELILKSFGYFTSTERLKPLYQEQERIKEVMNEIKSLQCPYILTDEDVISYNKLKNTYIQYKKILNDLKKHAKPPNKSPEVLEYENITRNLLKQLRDTKCHFCKQYHKHIKNTEISVRFEGRHEKISKAIEYEKDIYWRQFLNLMNVLEEMGYLFENYPTDKGLTAAAIRYENELFLSELIKNGILEDLSPSELSAILCAVVTEEPRNDIFVKFSVSGKVRKAIFDSREILRKVLKVQKKHNVSTPVSLNPQFAPLIEFWAEGGEWDELIKGLDVGEGDVVRIFKRTIDLLRQLTIIPGVSRELARTASIALDNINREPILEIF